MKKSKIILFSILFFLSIKTAISCSEENKIDEKPKVETGTVTDIDGNVYKTIKIGTQWWMAENLRTTKFRNGEAIQNTISNTDWASLSSPSYCFYNNDFETYGRIYGAFYNWKAVNDNRNIAPEGWHIPSDDEWKTLIYYLGGFSVAGGKMKEAGTTHWISPNTGATNSSRFTALPTGSRGGTTGEFGWIGLGNDYWCATSNTDTEAWAYYVGNDIAGCLRLSHNKLNGFVIRCIKD